LIKHSIRKVINCFRIEFFFPSLVSAPQEGEKNKLAAQQLTNKASLFYLNLSVHNQAAESASAECCLDHSAG